MQNSSKYKIGRWLIDEEQSTLKDGEDIQRLDNKVFELLMFLLEHKGEVVTRTRILDEVWVGVVVADDVLNVTISTLRKHLGDDPKDPQFIKTIPRKGYQWICQVSEVSSIMSSDNGTGHGRVKPTPQAIAVFVFLVLLSFVYFGFMGDERSQSVSDQPVKIAVLPFNYFAADTKDAYIADGLTDAITNQLVQSSGLQVTSRTSVMRFKGKDSPIKEIAKQLNVDWILEGSVQVEGQTLNITAQLINVVDDSHVWSESYQRDRHDLFAIQLDIANQIGRKFDSAPGVLAKHSSIPANAYDRYLQARYLQANGQLEKADSLYLQAIQIYPSYTEALAGRSLLAFYTAFGAGADTARWTELGSKLAIQAHELNQPGSDVYLAMALHYFYVEHNMQESGRLFAKAYQMNHQDIMIQEWYLHYLMANSLFNQAQQVITHMMEVSPLAYNKLAQFDIYYYQRRFEDAVSEVNNKAVYFNDASYIASLKAQVFLVSNDTRSLLLLLPDLLDQETVDQTLLNDLKEKLGENDLSGALSSYIPLMKEKVSGMALAGLYAKAGDTAESMQILRQLVTEKRLEILKIKVDPVFDSLKSLPEYQQLVSFK